MEMAPKGKDLPETQINPPAFLDHPKPMQKSTKTGLLLSAILIVVVAGFFVYWAFYTVPGIHGPMSPPIPPDTTTPIDGKITAGGSLLGYTTDFTACLAMAQPTDYGVGFYESEPESGNSTNFACYTYNAASMQSASGCIGPAQATGDVYSNSLKNQFAPCNSPSS